MILMQIDQGPINLDFENCGLFEVTEHIRQTFLRNSSLLPRGWTEYTSETTGETYYHNAETGESKPRNPRHFESGRDRVRHMLYLKQECFSHLRLSFR